MVELVAPAPAEFQAQSECNYIEPATRVLPVYPPRAAAAHQPGWVALEYDVAPDGSTTNVHVVDASPAGMFDAASVEALKGWRYPASSEAHAGCRLLLPFRSD